MTCPLISMSRLGWIKAMTSQTALAGGYPPMTSACDRPASFHRQMSVGQTASERHCRGRFQYCVRL